MDVELVNSTSMVFKLSIRQKSHVRQWVPGPMWNANSKDSESNVPWSHTEHVHVSSFSQSIGQYSHILYILFSNRQWDPGLSVKKSLQREWIHNFILNIEFLSSSSTWVFNLLVLSYSKWSALCWVLFWDKSHFATYILQTEYVPHAMYCSNGPQH